ncbi:thioredoxin domain-containing protein 17 [Rhinatrema bivittatum]|uniref:thioredoxin domain-containing protein 17 n=1 Tax=Rhinatrema bivittatum TaxID=194408 RepID=UPI001129BAC1|nr:thioredoxin domain-containing protein 17 [Rhinatrema bivittatum]
MLPLPACREEAGCSGAETGSELARLEAGELDRIEAGELPPPPLSEQDSPPESMDQCTYLELKARGFEEFSRIVDSHKGQAVFVLFSGAKNEAGISWCPDCMKAEPIVRENLQYLPEDSVFVHCDVGEKDCWKDPSNDFKKNLKLTALPTLLKYGTPQKLVEDECFKTDLVRMVFTED